MTIEVISYLLGIILVIYLIFKVFFFLIQQEYNWQRLYIFLLIALALDILSTIYFVYFLQLGWSSEMNYMVRRFGDSMGHLNALLLNHFALAIILGLFGFFTNKILEFITYIVYNFFIFILILTILTNIIMSTLVVIFK